jgi:tetratricopeptide (TPR) repeat protein
LTQAHRLLALLLGLAAGAAVAAQAAPPKASMTTQQVRSESEKVLGAGWKGNVDQVRYNWQEAARKAPSDPLPRILLAFCTFPSDDAWNQFKAIAQLYPDNTWAHLGMGLVYVHWKMRDQAKNEFETALKLDPAFYPALVGLGDLAVQGGDMTGAEAKYRQALKLNDDAQAHAGLGSVLMAQGKESEGRKELAASFALWKDQPKVVQELFTAAKADNDLKKAAEYAEALAALKSRDRDVRKQLADLRYELGQKDVAAQEYERLLRLGNPDKAVVERLAGLYKELGNADKEETVLYQLSSLEKSSPRAPLRLAELAKAKGNAESEEGHLLEAISRDPKCVPAHLEIARLREEKGVLHEAVLALRAAAAVEGPEQAAIKERLDTLEKSLKLAPKPAKGTPDAIYGKVAASLNALFLERRAAKPALQGELKFRVRVDDKGVVQSVDVLSDTVGDPTLVAHVYFSLHDAEYPKSKREPVFSFELGPKKK